MKKIFSIISLCLFVSALSILGGVFLMNNGRLSKIKETSAYAATTTIYAPAGSSTQSAPSSVSYFYGGPDGSSQLTVSPYSATITAGYSQAVSCSATTWDGRTSARLFFSQPSGYFIWYGTKPNSYSSSYLQISINPSSAQTIYISSCKTFTTKLNYQNGNSGTLVALSSFSRGMYSVSDITLPTPTRTGYTFKYWSTTSTGGSTYEGGKKISGQLYADGTLYAQWTPLSYGVTFDKQSGSGGTNSTTVTYHAQIASVSVPIRSGYVFGGYWTGKNGTGTKYYNYNGAGDRIWDIASATILYAYWIPVTLDKQSGSGGTTTIPSTSSTPFAYGKAMPSITPPTRTGYNFQGYYSEANGGGTKYYNANGSSANTCTFTSSTTLYAYWKGINYNVLFHSNYGVDSTSSQGPFTYGTAQTLRENTFSRTGYTFQGWATSASSKTVSYGNQASVSTLTTADGNTVGLYAVWKANTYTVTLNNQSATTAGTASVTATFDSDMPGITVPKRTGYTLQGYYSEIDGAGTKYYKADGTSASAWNIDANTTLYAYWTINQYTLTLNPNGGVLSNVSGWTVSGSNLTKSMDYNSNSGTLPMPTREGYIFAGWYTSSTAGSFAGSSVTIGAENKIIYARWEETWTNAAKSLNLNSLKGGGAKTNPYLIESENQLALLALKLSRGEKLTSSSSKTYFKQMKNLDFSGKIWLPIGSEATAFEGTYDGNGYLIKNLNTLSTGNVSYSNVGLFGYTKNATLQNINIISGNVTGNNNVGSIVGYMNNGSLTGSKSGALVNGNETCGLVGRGNSVRIVSCYNYGNITGVRYAGGILGVFEGSLTKDDSGKILPIIENCYSKCNVQANSGYAGGILGYSNVSGSEIKASGYNGSVSGSGSYIKSIAGSMTSAKITDCFANTNTTSYYGGSATVNAFIYTIKNSTTKKYVGSDFSAWSITASGTPLPKGFSWLGLGGEQLTASKLQSFGFKA